MAKKKRKEFDIGGNTRLKPLSLRVLFTATNLVLFILGVNLFFNLNTSSWLISLFAFVFGVISLVEVGLKKFTKLSSLKEFGLLQWIGIFTSTLVFIFSIIGLFGVNILALSQLVGTLFMGASIVTTVDLWF